MQKLAPRYRVIEESRLQHSSLKKSLPGRIITAFGLTLKAPVGVRSQTAEKSPNTRWLEANESMIRAGLGEMQH